MASHPDPVELITRFGATFSPSLDDYATGQIDADQIVCVLCGIAPCACGDRLASQ